MRRAEIIERLEKADTDLIAEAIMEAFGERCPGFEPGCWCCRAWRQYDDMGFVLEIANRNEQSPEGDRLALARAKTGAGE